MKKPAEAGFDRAKWQANLARLAHVQTAIEGEVSTRGVTTFV